MANRLRYANNPMTSVIGWSSDRDNPRSPAYIPVEERSETEKAIWWADLARRKPAAGVGVFDDSERLTQALDRAVG